MITEDDILRIAEAIDKCNRAAFHIEEEKHYNSHARLDKLLDAYDSASSLFVKVFLALVIVGMIVIAGLAATKGWK